MDYHTGRLVVFDLHARLVFVTKYRRGVLTSSAIDSLKSIFEKVCCDFDAQLVECDGKDDHVHLLIQYQPKTSLSKLVNSLKGVSSRRLRQKHPDIAARYYKGVLWSPSYFVASCGGAPLAVVAEYVKSHRERASSPPSTKGSPREESR